MAEEEPVDTPPVEEPQGPVIPDGVSLPEGLELILTEDEIADFFKSSDDELQKKIAAQLGLEDYGYNFQTQVIVDFHMYNIKKCDEFNLSAFKGVVFHAIMSNILGQMSRRSEVSEYKGLQLTVEEAFAEYKKLMLGCTSVFTMADVRLLTDHASLTFFNHYLLYQYALLFPREEENLYITCELQEPPAMPDMTQAREIYRPAPKAKQEGPIETVVEALQQTRLSLSGTSETDFENNPELKELLDTKLAKVKQQFENRLAERAKNVPGAGADEAAA